MASTNGEDTREEIEPPGLIKNETARRLHVRDQLVATKWRRLYLGNSPHRTYDVFVRFLG